MEEEQRREEARQREQGARAAFEARPPRGTQHFRAFFFLKKKNGLCTFQANLYCLFHGESCEGEKLQTCSGEW